MNHQKRKRQGELTTKKHPEGNRTYHVHAVTVFTSATEKLFEVLSNGLEIQT